MQLSVFLRRVVVCAWGAALAAFAPGAAWAERVASLNLCTDQLALMLADHKDIIGVSTLARDCTESVLCQQAQDVPVLQSTAETVLAAKPDVVLAGRFTARLAVRAAKEVGAKVLTLPPASSLADIPDQIMQVANAVGQPERGRQLVAAFQARLAEIATTRQVSDPIAVVYEANGFVVHAHSLPDDVLAHAGLRNFATTAGTPPLGRRVPLEVLLAYHPDLLVRDPSGPGHSLAQAMLSNPVMLAMFAPPHVVDVPARLWLCGLPQTLDAVATLRHARDGIVADAARHVSHPPIAQPTVKETQP
ncbi:ABC transporter substrate-binding protein [Acetobacter sp. A11-2]|uniref:ABC transporter substrate-binding protein n=1 Tax=Acetobacter sp. A11-2 TaxID=3157859 RepID=UPI0032F0759E